MLPRIADEKRGMLSAAPVRPAPRVAAQQTARRLTEALKDFSLADLFDETKRRIRARFEDWEFTHEAGRAIGHGTVTLTYHDYKLKHVEVSFKQIPDQQNNSS